MWPCAQARICPSPCGRLARSRRASRRGVAACSVHAGHVHGPFCALRICLVAMLARLPFALSLPASACPLPCSLLAGQQEDPHHLLLLLLNHFPKDVRALFMGTFDIKVGLADGSGVIGA